MRFQTACGYFCFFLLLASSSWSWELNQFRRVKSKVGEFLCGMSPPNKTLNAVKSLGLCTSACFQVCPSACQAVNYWKNSRLCQHFYYIPCSHEVQQDCENYQVTIIDFRTFWNSLVPQSFTWAIFLLLARYVRNVAKRSMTCMISVRSIDDRPTDRLPATSDRRPTTDDRPTTSHLENFKCPYLREGSSDPLHVWFCGVFEVGGSDGAISGFAKSKMAAAAILKNSNGDITATNHPIYSVFGSRTGFSRSADRMALFPVWPNSTGMWEKTMREDARSN